jgi:hypothetical protein
MKQAIGAHKLMAMGITEGNKMKKGGKVAKFANGGAISESKVRTLPAKGEPLKANMTSGKAKIAAMKNGGMSKVPKGLMIAVAIGKKAPRGR